MAERGNGRLQEFREIVFLSIIAVFLGLVGGAIAYLLYYAIGAVTNLLYYGRLSWSFANPFDSPYWTSPYRPLLIVIPALGGLLIALMIRYGTSKISGHGEPETIEAILTSRSRIQPRVGLLKPISAAITIGSGGPFGAEGPIIQTGGAAGSLLGQVMRVTTSERKIMLASGAAAGMAAILGTPVAGILLVIELLLFEFRPRSFIPVAIASAVGGVLHYTLIDKNVLFPVDPSLVTFGAWYVALPVIALVGILCGVVGTGLTKLLYRLEDVFRAIPMNEFFIPILGGGIVGVLGYLDPNILGTGYVMIRAVLNTDLAAASAAAILGFLVSLLVLKALAWTIALSTGSSGGTLAPLFMMGGSFGAIVGVLVNLAVPGIGISVPAFALVGMAAVFAAASRATLASIVFGAEVTGVYQLGTFAGQNLVSALIPLVVGCVLADLVAYYLLGEETVMTGKLARRGIRVKHEYEANLLDMILVSEVMASRPRAVPATLPAVELRALMADLERPEYHMRSFPVVDASGKVIAIVTRNDLFRERNALEGKTVLDIGTKDPLVVHPDDTIYTALQKMVWKHVGHLPVVDDGGKVVGYLSRGDIHTAWKKKLAEEGIREGGLHIRRPAGGASAGAPKMPQP